ncbi:VanZ family protein [Xenophilus arseniciresistens]|uniref:VanZ family protein n=1 Tax=Xenophilus arseniciresistens TaxID=1283306 RepID=A0AAE3NCN8_9BURK|nr:VanZ family protein [Xenophilus arseniciresistens]MDA7418644.1 VanZ family protein [Xenophilus arseniciresistens]
MQGPPAVSTPWGVTSPNHKSSAWPLALSYAALIVYASLFPFTGWRDQGLAPWSYLSAPWPRYWSGFDLGINVVGYVPLGFLLAVGLMRARAWRLGGLPAVGLGTLAGAALAFVMESLQSYLPMRIASNLDLGLNAMGALIGATLAAGLVRLGLVSHWERARSLWFVDEPRGALVLLALWPAALLFPAAVPFGLGQVFERLEEALAEWLTDTPFLAWLPQRPFELQPLAPAGEMLCVALGLLVPCLLASSVARSLARRALLVALVLLAGLAVSALSSALSWGPVHAWAWLTTPVFAGVVLAAVLALALLRAPRRLSLVLVLLAVLLHLSLLNQAPLNAYFALTLATWEQGRFMRFHGLAQWLGWLWPFAVIVYAAAVLSRRPVSATS